MEIIMAEDMYEAEVYTLTDEEGNESQFELIGTCELEGVTYCALVPLDENGDDAAEEYVILKSEPDENGDDCLVTIEDDEEFDRVADIFEDEFSDIFYDDDEDGEAK
jgi:uncharacterized protein YrzB (UPF0473 family)